MFFSFQTEKGTCTSIIRDRRIRSDHNYLEHANISPGVSPQRSVKMKGEKATNDLVPLDTRISFYPRTHVYLHGLFR